MGVLAEVAKRVLRTAERAFRVDHPFGAEQGTEPCREDLRVLKHGECSMKAEFVLRTQRLQAVHKFSPKNFRKNLNWQKESRVRVNPPGVVRSQTAGRNYAV